MKQTGPVARWEFVTVAISMLVTAGLALYCIGCESFWFDEAHSARIIQHPWRLVPLRIYETPAMPLYFLVFRFWSMFGTSEAFLRSLSVLPAVATIPVAFMVGRRLFGPQEGALAAGLISLNSFTIHYAREARGYTLVMFLVVLSTLFFIKGIEESTRKRWILYTIVTALALATHVFAYGVVFAHALSLLFLKKTQIPWTPVIVAFGVLGLIVMPMGAYPLIHFLGGGAIDWITRPSWGELLATPSRLAGQSPFPYLVLVATIPVYLLLRGTIQKGRTLESWRYALVTLWFALPILGAFLASFFTPMFLGRYLIGTLPALALMIAVGLTHLRPRALAPLVFVGILFIAAVGLGDVYRDSKDDWRGAVAYIEHRAHPDDGLMLFQEYTDTAYEFYEDQSPSPMELERPDPEDSALSTRRDRIWLLINDVDTGANQRELRDITRSLETRFTVSSRAGFRGIEIRLYENNQL